MPSSPGESKSLNTLPQSYTTSLPKLFNLTARPRCHCCLKTASWGSMSRDGLGLQQVVVIPSSYKEEERLEGVGTPSHQHSFSTGHWVPPNTADIEQGGQALPKPQCAPETVPRATVLRGDTVLPHPSRALPAAEPGTTQSTCL